MNITATPARRNGVAEFQKALADVADKQFNSAQVHYDNAIDSDASDKYAKLYKAFYYMNRAVLRADMIDFISSIENNVQTLTMDDQGTTRARVKDQVSRSYDYSDAVGDMQKAVEIVVWVKDAAQNPMIAQRLMNPDERRAFEAELKERYAKLREEYAAHQQKLSSLDEARKNKLELF